MTTMTCLIFWMPPAISGRAGMDLGATFFGGSACTRTAPAIKAEVAPTIERRIHGVTIVQVAPSGATWFGPARKRHLRVSDHTPRWTHPDRALLHSSCSQ